MKDVQELIRQYAIAESGGLSRVPNRAIQAFSLEVFGLAGYPFRIETADELWRYHDVMQEGRFERNLKLIGDSANDELLELISVTASSVLEFSERRFGFASIAKDMLSRAVYQYVLIQKLLEGRPKPWSILEVGPGSGYLGLLLGLGGHRYTAIEASQAFFVYQSTLYRDIFRDKYSDGLTSTAADADLCHIPWWDFCSEASYLRPFTAGTANHMIAEMNPRGISYLFGKIHATQTEGFTVLAESLGAQLVQDNESVVRSVARQGFNAFEGPQSVWRFEVTRQTPQIVHHEESSRVAVTRKLFHVYSGLRRRRLIGPLLTAASRPLRNLVSRRSRRRNLLASENSRPTRVAQIFASYPDFESAEFRFERGTW